MNKSEDSTGVQTTDANETNLRNSLSDQSTSTTPKRLNNDENSAPFEVIDIQEKNVDDNFETTNGTEDKIGFWKDPIKGMKDFWNHPAGPMTIFFWAPAFKWALVIAGLSDLQRPAENLSILQTIALAATGIIWCRYSLVIIPKNYSLFSVNLFIAGSQCYQLYRCVRYQYFYDKS